jgi:glycosyltransferase involved in cell wall biosynthesis
MVDFTVAIPTYNGEQRLPEVLNRLQRQVGADHFEWEVIVIDNNSTDQTADVVRSYQAQWPALSTLYYLFEPRQGAAFARQRAVERAEGMWVGFLDDDNWPTDDWVATAFAFGQSHSHVGVYGGRVLPIFDLGTILPAGFERIAPYFAIVDRGLEAHAYQAEMKILPPGAGLVVQRQAWLTAVPTELVLNHRGKDAFLASEDLEAVLHIQKAGWEIWYVPEMLIQHHIPAWRLERNYLLSLVRCIGLSRHYIRMLRLAAWQRPLLTVLYFLNDLRRFLMETLRLWLVQSQDVVVACEWEMMRCSLIGPFFWLLRSRQSDLFPTVAPPPVSSLVHEPMDSEEPALWS